MNHESYVSLETAKMLKKAGFNWTVRSFYQEPLPGTSLADMFKHDPESKYERHDMPISHTDWNNHRDTQFKEDRIYYSAPTLAVAQRWLREEKNISVDAYGEWQGLAKLFTYGILILCPAHKPRRMWIGDDKNNITDFPTYEAAMEEGIVKCLKELI